MLRVEAPHTAEQDVSIHQKTARIEALPRDFRVDFLASPGDFALRRKAPPKRKKYASVVSLKTEVCDVVEHSPHRAWRTNCSPFYFPL
jgi:hypothetical protein